MSGPARLHAEKKGGYAGSGTGGRKRGDEGGADQERVRRNPGPAHAPPRHAPGQAPPPHPRRHPLPLLAPGAESAAAAAAMWAALPLLCAGAWLLGPASCGAAGLAVSSSGTRGRGPGAGDRDPDSENLAGDHRVGRKVSRDGAQGSGPKGRAALGEGWEEGFLHD